MPEATTVHERIKEIKRELRLAMNGVVSSHQRNQGLNYKVNFGVEIPRLKSIAANYTPCKEIALALWQDNIRECKLLAIFLLPQECYEEIAVTWISEAPFTEIADHLAKTILCNTANATEEALSCIRHPEVMFKYSGYLTLTHLFRAGKELNEEQSAVYLKEIHGTLSGNSSTTVANAAYNSFCRYIESHKNAKENALKFFGQSCGLAELLNDL